MKRILSSWTIGARGDMSSTKNSKGADNSKMKPSGQKNHPSTTSATGKTLPRKNLFLNTSSSSKNSFSNTSAKTDNFSSIQKINVMSTSSSAQPSDPLNSDS